MRRFCENCGKPIKVYETADAMAVWVHVDPDGAYYIPCRLPPKVAEPPEEIGLGPRLGDYTACEGVTDDGR